MSRGLVPSVVALLGALTTPGVSQNCAVPAGLEVLSVGTVGVQGTPSLLVTGVPAIGQASNLVHSGGPAGAFGCLIASSVEDPTFYSAYGATLHPGESVDRTVICFQLNDAGTSPPLLAAFDSIDPSFCGLTYVAQSIVVDAAAQGGIAFSDALRVTFGSGVEIPLAADQDTILAGNPTQVRFSAEVSQADLIDGDGVQLFLVDQDYVPQGAALCELLDNGELASGDDIGGDGVFSCLSMIEQPVSGPLRLAAFASIAGDGFWSQQVVVEVVDPLTPEDAALLVSGQDSAQASWSLALATLGDTTEARQQVVSEVVGLAGVAEAGISSDGQTIWIHYESGVRGGLMLNPPGTRGNSEDDTFERARYLPADGLPAPFVPSLRSVGVPPSSLFEVGATEPNITGNNRVMIWDAYNSQFAPNDESPALFSLFASSECPTFEVTMLVDGQATVSSVRSFTQYATVILVTHGAVDGDGQVVFLTREQADLSSILSNAIDLVLGRVSIMGDYLAIRPSFISSLSGAFEDGILYNGSCQSTANSTMNSAFFGKGMKAAFGYTKVVNSSFAAPAAIQLFTAMVDDSKTTSEAFSGVSPTTDPVSPFAVFTRSGNSDLEYSGAFRNGSFEDELEGWSTAGDGRSVVSLGEFQPTEGSRMGIISTGLGFTDTSGSIEQQFCLPENATTLIFDWNYSSEEFIEYCDWWFEDPFQVTLTTPDGTTVLLGETVNTLCGGVIPTNLFFDVSVQPCTPSEDVGYGTGGNDCTVWSTGWTQASIDISSIATSAAGAAVTLRFESSDAGDSIYDTAVLIDNIEIVTP